MGKDFRLRRFTAQNLSQLTTIYSDRLKFYDRVSEIDVIPSLSQNMSDSLGNQSNIVVFTLKDKLPN